MNKTKKSPFATICIALYLYGHFYDFYCKDKLGESLHPYLNRYDELGSPFIFFVKKTKKELILIQRETFKKEDYEYIEKTSLDLLNFHKNLAENQNDVVLCCEYQFNKSKKGVIYLSNKINLEDNCSLIYLDELKSLQDLKKGEHVSLGTEVFP